MPEGSERDIPIEGWDHFISCVSALDVGTAFAAPYVFRGQADATWGLEPSILRVVTSEIRLSARCPGRADVSQEDNWQLLPGDSDVL